MNILYTGRKAHLTPALKALAASKLVKLEKYLGDILDAHVILKREKHRMMAEMVVKVRSRTLTATAEGVDFDDAIAACAVRLLSQARRVSGRRIARRKGRGAWAAPHDGREAGAPDGEPESAAAPDVVRMGRMSIRSMTVREAVLRVIDSERTVLVFRDAASEQVAVLFRRPDGQVGLWETEA
jgi:putative sigma-54 modulation protein